MNEIVTSGDGQQRWLSWKNVGKEECPAYGAFEIVPHPTLDQQGEKTNRQKDDKRNLAQPGLIASEMDGTRPCFFGRKPDIRSLLYANIAMVGINGSNPVKPGGKGKFTMDYPARVRYWGPTRDVNRSRGSVGLTLDSHTVRWNGFNRGLWNVVSFEYSQELKKRKDDKGKTVSYAWVVPNPRARVVVLWTANFERKGPGYVTFSDWGCFSSIAGDEATAELNKMWSGDASGLKLKIQGDFRVTVGGTLYVSSDVPDDRTDGIIMGLAYEAKNAYPTDSLGNKLVEDTTLSSFTTLSIRGLNPWQQQYEIVWPYNRFYGQQHFGLRKDQTYVQVINSEQLGATPYSDIKGRAVVQLMAQGDHSDVYLDNLANNWGWWDPGPGSFGGWF